MKHAYGNFIAIHKEGEHENKIVHKMRMIGQTYTLLESSKTSITNLTDWIRKQLTNANVKEVAWIPNKEMIVDTSTYKSVKSEIIMLIISDGKLAVLKRTSRAQFVIHNVCMTSL